MEVVYKKPTADSGETLNEYSIRSMQGCPPQLLVDTKGFRQGNTATI